MILRPAAIGTGVRFVRTDLQGGDSVVPAHIDRVSASTLGTTISNEAGVSVATVEHLLAACAGIGVSNLLVEIDGPEVPIMDGSSALYCELLLKAGLVEQAARQKRLRVLEPVVVEDGVRRAEIAPVTGDALTVRAEIVFDACAAIKTQSAEVTLFPGAFMDEVAFARTFGFIEDVQRLRANGLALGGSLDNTVVLEGGTVLNPEGLRSKDEFVRHKILDAVGDLALAGAPIAGAYHTRCPGHAINAAILRKLFSTPDAWCWEWGEVRDAQQMAAASAR